MAKEKLLATYKDAVLPGPLNSKIVLGFCYYLAGPIALQSLVNQGALVIKIERKPIGDPSRYVFSKGLFNSLSYNQLSIAFDYSSSEDRQLLKSLLEIADVIIDNRSVRAKGKDSILQDHLNNTYKPNQQVYCSINGYPNEQVYNNPALDASIQAETGLAFTNCASPDTPLKVGIPILDQVTGLLAAYHIIASLYLLHRFPTLPDSAKKIIYISVSMAGAAMWLQTGQVIRALEGKDEFFRSGNQDQFAVPFSYYTTKNGLISVATVNEDQFKKFCLNVLKDEAFHKKYPTIQIRLEKQQEFEQDLNQKLKTEPREYWNHLCRQQNLPASPVLTVSEAIEQDFFKEVLNQSTNGRPIITHGARNPFFKKVPLIPGPSLDRDHEKLSKLFLEDPHQPMRYMKASL
jgi:CoA:oxalate CoA-transferase